MSRTTPLLLLLAAFAAGCGDPGRKPVDTSGRGERGAAAAQTARAPTRDTSAYGVGGSLAIPGLEGAPSTARDAGPALSPEERDKLRATLDAALADGRLEEAIATADVLAVLFPDDAEVLELRGRALGRQGDADGSARDLARCCELGRAACCAGTPR